jgi:aryl-alcohol dehydrogenase-like predicted oxidoreductase
MKNRQIASFSVSAIGLGCMNLSHAYGAPVSAQQGERVLLAALDQGVNFFRHGRACMALAPTRRWWAKS